MKAGILILTTALPLLVSCGGETPRRETAAAGAPVSVHVAPVAETAWAAEYEATGTVRAATAAVVSAKMMGTIEQVSVHAGDRVRQGQDLVVIDARDLDAGLRKAVAGQAEVRSAIPEADGAVAGAKAALDLAQATYKRMEDLLAKKSISAQEFDEASARLKGARAALEMAQARRTQLDAKLQQIDQDVRAATVARDYARIRAPFAGIVTARQAEPGAMATPGAPLFTIEQEGAYRLEATVEESRLAPLRVGQAVRVAIEALGIAAKATISEIVPAVDAASRAGLVKISLPSDARLRSGVFGRAYFPAGEKKALTVPEAALVSRGQVQSVFTVENGVAHLRLVTLGARQGGAVEVLSGLNAGEKVVSPAPPSLSDGARVEVRP